MRAAAQPERIGWSVESVLHLVEDGENWLAHYVMARKLLRQTTAFAIRVANAFEHHPLTRDECEGLLEDFADDLPPLRASSKEVGGDGE